MDCPLRHLDVDSLYVLSYLHNGKSMADAARFLRLSSPAMTQRVARIEAAFDIKLIEKSGKSHKTLTKDGLRLAEAADVAIKALQTVLV